jgi:beta-galactosidase
MNSQQNFQWETLSLGVCYYPEHWDRSLWKTDLERMLKVGIKTVRIAEFAWSKFERTEGEFTFEFFDSFMDVAKEMGMQVIFGTPTATPPAWLTKKYPEVLNRTIDEVALKHGARRHYNYNSPKYQELSKIIVEKLGEHYGQHPNIVGWQIDNEINCEVDVFYSESDTIAFREFLKEKYVTLDALNMAWGTTFWNQTYTAWDEVYVPRTTVNDSTNPHEVLDYTRFISESAIRYCRMQSDILRKYIRKGVYITTNGKYANLDNHRMTKECLDVYTYDSYPNFAYCLIEDPKNNTQLNDRKWSDNLNEVRSICPHFGIMEQQSGANGWNTRMEAPSPKPGQMALWTMQSIAHGADYVSFFRWRTCTMGTEIYWHGILDYDNCDNRKLAEVKAINERVKKLEPMTGAIYKAAFGLLKDYSNIWDAQLDRWHSRVDLVSNEEIFIASQLTHTPVDYLYIQKDSELEELTKYPVLIYPHALILSEERMTLLKAYVKQGGILIMGCRTGQKDETGKCPMTKLPGLAAELVGATVSDFTFVGPNDETMYVDWNGTKIEAPIFNDILEVTGGQAKVLGRYIGNYYDGKPALIENTYGKGKVLYFGGTFTRENIKMFLEYAGILTPFADIIQLSYACELSVREKGGKTYYFVLNFSHETVEITLKSEMTDVDTEKKMSGNIKLKAYETKVYCI